MKNLFAVIVTLISTAAIAAPTTAFVKEFEVPADATQFVVSSVRNKSVLVDVVYGAEPTTCSETQYPCTPEAHGTYAKVKQAVISYKSASQEAQIGNDMGGFSGLSIEVNFQLNEISKASDIQLSIVERKAMRSVVDDKKSEFCYGQGDQSFAPNCTPHIVTKLVPVTTKVLVVSSVK